MELKFGENVHHPSIVTCYVSDVTRHMSHLFIFCFTMLWSWLVEGLLSTGPTPSTLQLLSVFFQTPLAKYYIILFNLFGPLYMADVCIFLKDQTYLYNLHKEVFDPLGLQLFIIFLDFQLQVFLERLSFSAHFPV